MGQYYLVVNLSKQQFLHPHHCGNGVKLMEFAPSSNGTMACLGILLAAGNGRGGGDLRSDSKIIGSWAGDRIVIAGDYADEGQWTDDPTLNLYDVVSAAGSPYVDVSFQAMHALLEDSSTRTDISESIPDVLQEYGARWENPPPLPLRPQ